MTPVQYAALQAVDEAPGIDQRALARRIGFDTSTIGGVVDGLEARGLLQRNASPHDRPVRLLTLTDDGRALIKAIVPAMLQAQQRILAPLASGERSEFMKILRKVVTANNDLSRAPGGLPAG